MPRKIKVQKYLNIRKGTNKVRNAHILHTLPILHYFDVLQIFSDIV